MSRDSPHQVLSYPPAPILLIATGLVFLGTAWVDPSRLWLLMVPIVFLIAAYGAGALVDRAAGGLLLCHEAPPMVVLSARIGVGLACFSLLTVLSALCGMLWVAGLVALPAIAYGLVCALRAVFQLRPLRGPVSAGIGGGLLGVAWLVAWLWATIPPTFYDELAYHLVIPQRALATGGLLTVPWVHYTLMPHASDLLLVWGMILGGDLGARALLFALWVVCTLAAWALAEAILYPVASPWVSSFVACALAASPTLWFLATLPFAETGLTAGVVSMAVLLASPHAERRPWLAFGLVLGLIATVKLSGLYWVAAGIAAAITVRWPRRDIGRAGLIALASVAPWWERAFVQTGNPIYPMFYRFLGGWPWSEESQARLMADLPYGASGSLGLQGLLRLPLDLVQHPERFGSASDVGALAVGAVCLALLVPISSRLTGVGERERWLGDALSVFILVAGAGWIITSPTTRFFAPAFVVGLAGLVGVLLRLRQARQAIALLLLLALGVWGTFRFLDQHTSVFSSWNVALGREKADDYLARQLDHFTAARFVRENLPPDARLLFIGETRPYYFSRGAVAPYPFDAHPLQRWVQESPSVDALVRRLVAEGITHVVLNVHEFRRHRDGRGLLVFSGNDAPIHTLRLKELPGALRLLFEKNGVYVFEVPRR